MSIWIHLTYKVWWYVASTILLLCTVSTSFAAPLPFSLPSIDQLSRLRSGIIATSKGKLYFELYPESAPWHVANFKYLADRGSYRNVTFHKHTPGYAIEGGKVANSLGYSIPAEFNSTKHQLGVIGMARKPDPANPERNSEPAQFYILLADSARLDGAYTIFGRVVAGLDVLSALRAGDMIQEVIVYAKP